MGEKIPKILTLVSRQKKQPEKVTPFIQRKNGHAFFSPKPDQRAVNTLTPFIQPSLTVSQPGDPFEQEADEMADQVMLSDRQQPVVPSGAANEEEDGNVISPKIKGFIMPKCTTCEAEEEEGATVQRKSLHTISPSSLNGVARKAAVHQEQVPGKKQGVGNVNTIFRKCDHCEAGETTDEPPAIQMKTTGSATSTTSPSFQSYIQSSRSAGRPMDKGTSAQMQQKMGYDFSSVNIHTGNDAERASESINAKAFTYGSDIYFNAGQYQPGTSSGQWLLAHELTHTVQQSDLPRMVQKKGDPSREEQLAQQFIPTVDRKINLNGIYFTVQGEATFYPGKKMPQLLRIVLKNILQDQYREDILDPVVSLISGKEFAKTGQFADKNDAYNGEKIERIFIATLQMIQLRTFLLSKGYTLTLNEEENQQLFRALVQQSLWEDFLKTAHKKKKKLPGWYTKYFFDAQVELDPELLERYAYFLELYHKDQSPDNQEDLKETVYEIFDELYQIAMQLDSVRKDLSLAENPETQLAYTSMWYLPNPEKNKKEPSVIRNIPTLISFLKFSMAWPDVFSMLISSDIARIDLVSKYQKDESFAKSTVAVLPAFPSLIVSPDMNADHTTVKSATNFFRMVVSFQQLHGSGVHGITIAMAMDMYFSWKIFHMPEALKVMHKQDGMTPEKMVEITTDFVRNSPSNLANPVHTYDADEEYEQYIPMSDAGLGDFVLMGIAAPKYRDDLLWAQTPSTSGFPFHVLTPEEITRSSTFAEADALARMEEKIKNAPEAERAELEKEVSKLKAREAGTLGDITKADLNDTNKILSQAKQLKEFIDKDTKSNLPFEGDKTTDPFYIRLKRQDEGLYNLLNLVGEMFSFRVYRIITAVEEFIKLVTTQVDDLTRLKKRSDIAGASFHPAAEPYRVIAALSKEDDGNLVPLLIEVGLHPDSNPEKGIYKMKLWDVSIDAPDKDDMVYTSDVFVVRDMNKEIDPSNFMYLGATFVSSAAEAENKAIENVLIEFGHYNNYGTGQIQYRVPKKSLSGVVASDTTSFEYLQMVIAALGIIAIIAGTVASLGTLTPVAAAVVTGLSISIAVVGGLMALHNISDRKDKGTFEWDLETALDIVSIVGSVVVAIGAIRTISISASRLSATAKVMMLERLEKVLFIYDVADFGTNVILISAKVKSDVDAIKALKLPKEQEAEMIASVTFGAIQQGAMMAVSIHGMGKQARDFYRTKVETSGYSSFLDKGWIKVDDQGNHAISEDAPPFFREALTKRSTTAGEKSEPDLLRLQVAYEEVNSIRTLDEDHLLTLTERGDIIRCSDYCQTIRDTYPQELLKNPELHKKLGEIELKASEAAKSGNQALSDEALVEAQSLEAALKLASASIPPMADIPTPVKVETKPSTNTAAIPVISGKDKSNIRKGDEATIQKTVAGFGDWKTLVISLGKDKKTLTAVVAYRQKIVDDLKLRYNGTELSGASKYPESDVDINLIGQKDGQIVDAGKNLIDAENEMRSRFGDQSGAMFRLNFYTGSDRLTKVYTSGGIVTPSMEAEITSLAKTYSFAKMLQQAKGNPESEKRVKALMELSAKDETPAIELLAVTLSQKSILEKRDALHLEVDDLVRKHAALPDADPQKQQIALEITKKQMQINFYTEEAYIGPGALTSLSGGPLTENQRIQAIVSNLQTMEDVIRHAGHDIVKAMREYELYKYMSRISTAIDKPQKDLFFDYLNNKIATVNREGAKGMTDSQLKGLYDGFMNMVSKELGVDSGISTPGNPVLPSKPSDTPASSPGHPGANPQGTGGSSSGTKIFKPGDPEFFGNLKVGETRYYEDLDQTVGKATRLTPDVHQIEVELTFSVATRGDFQIPGLPRPEGLPAGKDGFEALHPVGPITGHEAAYGFLFGPFDLNRSLQEHGVESFIQDFGKPKDGVKFTLRVTVERYLGRTYPGVEFLKDIRYEIIASGEGIPEPPVIFRTEIVVRKPDDAKTGYDLDAYLDPNIDQYLKTAASSKAMAKVSKIRRARGDVRPETGTRLISDVKTLIQQLRSIPASDKRKVAAGHYIMILNESIRNKNPDFVTRDMVKNVQDNAEAIRNLFPECKDICRKIAKIPRK